MREGVFIEDGRICVRVSGARPYGISADELALEGEHNQLNVMAALAAVCTMGLPDASITRVLRGFRTLEHRIEPCGRARGVTFVNDSKSTTVESTMAAIRAVRGPIVLVAGGRDKGADFATLLPLLRERVRAAVLYGEARHAIERAWRSFAAKNAVELFEDAVRIAFSRAKRGDTLLLSPMCTSFDQFSCYEERGEVFKRVARKLGARGAGHGRA